jgi:hypothetical protein
MPSVDPVVLELRADVNGFTGNISQATSLADRSFRQIEQSAERVDGAMRGSGRTSLLLGQQFSQMGQQVAAGGQILQSIAIQLPDLALALGETNAKAGSLAAFFGGPWGVALTTAAALAGAFASKLYETDDALEQVKSTAEQAADSLQKLWAGLESAPSFGDAATDQIKAMVEAQSRLVTAQRNLNNAQTSFSPARVQGGSAQIIGGASAAGQDIVRYQRQVDQAKKDIQTAQQGLSSIRAAQSAAALQERNRDINNTAPKKGSRPKKGAAPYDAANHQAQDVARLEAEELRAKLSLATDADERADIERDLLSRERDAAVARINLQAKLTAAQKQAQIDIINRTYGRPAGVAADGTMTANAPGLLGQKINRDLEDKKAQLSNDQLRREADTLESLAGIETNTKKRSEIEETALRLHQEIERNLLEQAISSGQIAAADAERARTALGTQQAAERVSLMRQNESPWTRYMHDLRDQAGNVGDAFEEAAVRGADRLTDSLAEATKNALGLHGVLGDIVGDFLEIAIKQAMINAAGGGGSIFSAVGSLLGIGGTKLSGIDTAGITNMANTIKVDGFRAGGGPVRAGRRYLVGEDGPEILDTGGHSGNVIPNHMLNAAASGTSGQVAGTITIALTEDLNGRVANIAGPLAVRVVSASAAPIAASGSTLAREKMTRSARNTIR